MIEAHGLTRRFGTFAAVSQVSLRVPDGSLLALLGPNGAGKTTTVRMLSGLLAPTEGDAIVGGYDVRRQPDAVRACVGLVTDVPGLFEQMTVPAYLDFFGSIYGMSAEKRSRRIEELLAFFELTEHCKDKMASFSKGMKQKVALARALIPEKLRARSSGEAVVRIEFAGACPLPLETLQTMSDIHSAQFINGNGSKQKSNSTTAGQVVEYRTAHPREVNPQVLTRLITAGAQVVSVACETSTLEDVYASAMQSGAEPQTAHETAPQQAGGKS